MIESHRKRLGLPKAVYWRLIGRQQIMPTYNLFQFKIKPALNSEFYGRVSGGSAAVLVDDCDAAKALSRAREYLTAAKWEITKETIFPQFTEELKPSYPELIQMQNLAKLKGIGCAYYIGVGGAPMFN